MSTSPAELCVIALDCGLITHSNNSSNNILESGIAFDAMFHKDYRNFVKPNSAQSQFVSNNLSRSISLNGEEAKKLYLEEVKDVEINGLSADFRATSSRVQENATTHRKQKSDDIDTSNRNLFLSVQNNDVSTVKKLLQAYPDKINIVDEFGWSLLMIACQANSVETVKELLKKGIDTSVRDKAGNSARTLVIKNKNLILADMLLNTNNIHKAKTSKTLKEKPKEEYTCEICSNKVFPDKQEHLSSTVHNINASKGKKIPTSYTIPESNRGYQIMLKVGWDKDSGLGKDGSGKKYPVKAFQKLDRKGLGLEKKCSQNLQEKESLKTVYKKKQAKDYHENRRFEVNFRREFY